LLVTTFNLTRFGQARLLVMPPSGLSPKIWIY